MNLQNLLEHSQIAMELLKKLKIDKKNNLDLVPMTFAKMTDGSYTDDENWEAKFAIKDPGYNLFIIGKVNGMERAIFYGPIDGSMGNKKSITYNREFVINFLNVPKNLSIANIIDSRFTPWAKYLKYSETKKILIQEARRQAQQQNWPFL